MLTIGKSDMKWLSWPILFSYIENKQRELRGKSHSQICFIWQLARCINTNVCTKFKLISYYIYLFKVSLFKVSIFFPIFCIFIQKSLNLEKLISDYFIIYLLYRYGAGFRIYGALGWTCGAGPTGKIFFYN